MKRTTLLFCCLSLAVAKGEIWSATERTSNQTIWQATTYTTNDAGVVTPHRQTYVTLAAGLNVPQADGSFVAADPSFIITGSGAVATNTVHKVQLPADIYSGPVVITLNDLVLESSPLSFGYYDPVDGSTITLGTLQSGPGWRVSPSEVVYSNCFSGGIRASLLLRNRISGFSQNLLLHEAPPPPAVYGMSDHTVLELLTEFAPTTPEPVRQTRVLFSETDPVLRSEMFSPDQTDTTLTFGGLRMGRGMAFAVDNSTGRRQSQNVPVLKSYEVIDSRNILIESVQYRRIKDSLTNLPAASLPGITNASVTRQRSLPIKRMAQAATKSQMKQSFSVPPGIGKGREYAFVLDYEVVLTNAQHNYRFYSDVTYRLADLINLTGDTVMEGGAVLKADPFGGLYQLDGSFQALTSERRPVVFTIAEDSTVGAPFTNGTLTQTFQCALTLEDGVTNSYLEHFRYRYQGCAIFSWFRPLDIRHHQFLENSESVTTYSDVYLGNALVANGTAGVQVHGNLHVENVTFSDIGTLNTGSGTAVITNSLLVAVGTLGTFTGANNATNPSPTNVFVRAGEGHFYVTNASYLSGTTNIKSAILSVLRTRTTEPPVVITNQIFSATTNLVPQVDRYTNAPAIGFHYPVVDYYIRGLTVSNATVIQTNGAVVALAHQTNGYAVELKSGAWVSEGEPLALVRLVRSETVQENLTVGATNALFYDGNSSDTENRLRLRYATFEQLGGNGTLFASGKKFAALEASHSEVHNVNVVADLSAGNAVVGLTNTAWIRGDFYLAGPSTGAVLFAHNNLIGLSRLNLVDGMTTNWAFTDNLFSGVIIGQDDSPVRSSHNAYYAGSGTVTNSSSDLTLTNLVFEAGSLGAYYQPTNSPLINQGSRTASAASLYHFTSTTNQVRETNSTVEIGLHYVVVTSTTNYLDEDADGLPDWYEDRNGNGASDSGETPWDFFDTDGDGLPDWYEVANGTSTNNWDSDGDGIGDNHLTLYFEMDHPSKPQGDLIRGPGFRVYGDVNFQPYGAIWIFFQQTYRGLPLNEWTGTGTPAAHESGILYELPAPTTGQFTKYLVKYDLRNRRWSVTNSSGVKLVHEVLWRDNMTEALGTNGPSTLWVTNVSWIQSATYTPAPFSRSGRYIWEGVIGNNSQEAFGPSVHSPWWPILNMVSSGTNVFYTGGYNEGKYDVQKFHTANPQFVITNFSESGKKQGGNTWVLDIAMKDATTLYVWHTNKSTGASYTNSYHTETCTNIAEGLTDWPAAPTIGFSTNGYAALALHPNDSEIAALYYTNREQVVVYTNAQSANPSVLFIIGVLNGYSNGPSITIPTNTHSFRTNELKLCSYYFDRDVNPIAPHRVNRTVLCFQSDGKLWVSDAATGRMLRFTDSGLCDSWFMNGIHTYTCSVDPNNPQRAFLGNLEFRVDYNQPLRTSWVLTNYWGRTTEVGAPEIARNNHTENGLFSVVTLTNNSTYALVWERKDTLRMVELTPVGLRLTTVRNLDARYLLEADGAMLFVGKARSLATNAVGTATNFEAYVIGFTNADPLYATQILNVVTFTNGLYPVGYNFKRSGSANIMFYPDWNHDGVSTVWQGSHLGAVSAGAWQWTNAPTGGFDGEGKFEWECNYAGSDHHVVDGNIFFIHRAEFWKHKAGFQGNQIFHFRLGGEFVGQFGTPNLVDGTLLNAPGMAANVWRSAVVKTNGYLYLYTSDEASHGLHRWRVEP